MFEEAETFVEAIELQPDCFEAHGDVLCYWIMRFGVIEYRHSADRYAKSKAW